MRNYKADVIALSAAIAAFAITGSYSMGTQAEHLRKVETKLESVQEHVRSLESDAINLRSKADKAEADDILTFRVLSSHGKRIRRFERAIPVGSR